MAASPRESLEVSLTAEQGEVLIRKHFRQQQFVVKSLAEIKNKGYSFTSGVRTYILDIGRPNVLSPCSCFVTISQPQTSSESYHPNSLPIVYDIISRIRQHTDIPIPESTLDTSCENVPFHYIISPASPISSASIIPLSSARKSGMMSEQETVLVDLQLGKFLGQLHSNVQNDWFGQPCSPEPTEPSYSWQETFTSLLESLLLENEALGTSLPYEAIRRYLSRAIGFFLFDDVEVPSLIWFTGSEDDIYIALPSHPPSRVTGIAAILPNLSHALWGDPLLESFFKQHPGPSAVFLEGYTASGGGQLTVFARQKTKRIWYTLFLALVVLKERSATETGRVDEIEVSGEWSKKLIKECVEALENAPCY